MPRGNYFLQDIIANADIIENTVNQERASSRKKTFGLHLNQRSIQEAERNDKLIEAMIRCGNIRLMSTRMEATACEATEEALRSYLSLLLSTDHFTGRPIICVFAPMFNSGNVTDGYYRRIKNIDSLFPGKALRIHFYPNPQTHWASARIVDQNHILIEYEQAHQVKNLFESIAQRARFIYCHSIHCFDADLINDYNGEVVLDLHGAVPEEELALFGDEERARALERVEKLAVSRASVMVAVTNSMVRHIQEKHPEESSGAECLVMPIFDMDNSPVAPIEKTACVPPTVIYAGGTQAWQLFDEMIDAIESQPNLCQYRLFLPDTSELSTRWSDHSEPAMLTVGTKSPEALREEYLTSDFGFILRDSSTVNKVACPTKLIEYLSYGVIPIAKNPDIGDFKDDGMAYLAIEDFRAGKLPSAAEQQSMRETNYRVITVQTTRFSQAKKTLTALFNKLAQNERLEKQDQ